MVPSNDAPAPSPAPPAGEQGGQQQVRVRIDERNMRADYANGFRANGTPDEVMIDFGLNVLGPGEDGQAELQFQLNERVILNYYVAKRLALTLGQLIRRHEEQYGELELDVAKRRKR